MDKRSRGVLEWEQRVGKMVYRLADTIRGRERQDDIVTAIVVDGRREIEPTGSMFCP